MAKEPCEPYGSYDESEIWLPKYWHIKKVTDQIHIDELIKQAIAEDYSTFENHKILCACRIQEALIEIARCFATAEREKSAGGFPESYYKVQKMQEWLNVSYAADISGCRHAPTQIPFQKINYKKSLKDKKCHYSPLYWNAISAIKRKK